MRIKYEIDIPNNWDESDVLFHRNESTWCSSNMLKELQNVENKNGCLCSTVSCEAVKILSNTTFLDE